MNIRAIHQFHYSVARHDAVTRHMLFLQETLRKAGIGGELFAARIRHRDELPVRPFRSEGFDDAELLLIHHSRGNPALGDVLASPLPKALMYHGVTPARFFSHDPEFQRECFRGVAQLADFRGHLIATFAASSSCARDLSAAGLPRAEQLPLFCMSDERGKSRGNDLLFVGDLSAHRRQRLLLQALFYLHRIENGTGAGPRRLVLVGRGDPAYLDYLRLLARALRLEAHVHFVDRVSPAALESYYQSAAAFVSLSAHEGFALPLVEAMRHQIPVFAYPAPGVRETLGRSGILLGTKKPHRIAEILATALADGKLLSAVRRHQSARLVELRREQCHERARELLLAALARVATPESLSPPTKGLPV